MALQVALHACRFVDYAPTGVVRLALHPTGSHVAVVRESGDLELWATSGSGIVSAPSADPAAVAEPNAQPWQLLCVIPGSLRYKLQCLSWVAVKGRSNPGVDGCRLFAGSLDGTIVEADFQMLVLRPAASSTGGSVWSVAAYLLSNAGGSVNSGAVLAVGCEDGSVRLMRVDPNSSALTPLVSCPGTDNRVLSLAWHPSDPILYAGTAIGSIRAWDLSATVGSILEAQAATQAAKSASAARSAARRKAQSAGSDSDTDAETESLPMALASSSPSSTVGPRQLLRFTVDARGKEPASVWSLAVSSTYTVISGDNYGSVFAWDGRSGTLAASMPILRHEGDVYSVALAEPGAGKADRSGAQASAGELSVVSCGADGRVRLCVREKSVAGDGVTPVFRWVVTGTHRGHAHAVRSVAIHPTGCWVVSGSADAQLCIVRSSELGVRAPTRVPSFSHRSGVAAVARIARLIATVTGSQLQLFALPGAGPSHQGASATANPDLLLSIDCESAALPAGPAVKSRRLASGLAVEVSAQAAAGPIGHVCQVAISDDGHWLAYSFGGDARPRLLYLMHTASASGGVDGVTPVGVPLEPALERDLTSASPATPTHMSLARTSDPGQCWFIFVVSRRVYVCKCDEAPLSTPAASALSGVKRDRELSAAVVPHIRHLYTLPVPHGYSEPVEAISDERLRGGASRPRSATMDSHVSATSRMSEAGDYAADDSSTDDASTKGSAFGKDGALSGGLSVRSTTNSAVIPIVTANDGGERMQLALATNARYVQLYRLAAGSGKLVCTLPRLVALPTAMTFSPCGRSLVVATRDGGLHVFSTETGRPAIWSPSVGPDRSRLPKALLQRTQLDSVHTLLAAAAAEASTALAAPFKLIAVGSSTVASVTITPTTVSASAAPATTSSSASNVSVSASMTDKHTNVLTAAWLQPPSDSASDSEKATNASASLGKKEAASKRKAAAASATVVGTPASTPSTAEVALIEVPHRLLAGRLPPAAPRKNYGT